MRTNHRNVVPKTYLARLSYTTTYIHREIKGSNLIRVFHLRTTNHRILDEMAGSQTKIKTTNNTKTSTKGNKKATAAKDPPTDNTKDVTINTNTQAEKTPMDVTQDTGTCKDSSGDIIMENKNTDGGTEYDSDGNNLYGSDENVSVSDETAVADNGSPNKRQKSTPKRLAPIFEKKKPIPECKTKTMFVAGIPVHKTKKAMDEYHRAIKDFLKHINEYDPTAILYEMYTTNPSTFEIKNWDNFPGKPSLVKQYLANCNPYAGEGQIWATFTLGLNECDESFLWVMKNCWGKDNGGFFKKKELQHNDTKQEIWFCLSHDDIDVDSLCQAQKNQYKFEKNETLELSLKYTTIKDGNSGFYKDRAREQDDSLGTRRYVKGIVAETTSEQFDSYYEWVMQTYSRSSTTFPQGIKLRAVPLISKEYDTDTQEKIKSLMQRQEHFQDSITSTFYLHVSNIDSKYTETGKTLREHLMNIPVSEKNQQPLFLSIGIKQWGKRKGDLLFTYPKKYAKTASRIVSNLNSYCYKQYGEKILRQFFSVRATKSAKDTTWNEEEGRAVSKVEQSLAEIVEEFDAMDYVVKPKSTAPKQTGQTTMEQHAPPVEQIDAETQDDISSFGNSLLGGQRQVAARASAFATSFNPPEDATVARSVAETVSSLDSRLTALESKLGVLDRMSAFLDRFENGKQSTEGSEVTPPSSSKGAANNSNNVVGDLAEESSSKAPAH